MTSKVENELKAGVGNEKMTDTQTAEKARLDIARCIVGAASGRRNKKERLLPCGHSLSALDVRWMDELAQRTGCSASQVLRGVLAWAREMEEKK